MDSEEETVSKKLWLQRIQNLSESLAAMRVDNKADVVLLCEEKKFYAHKCVLEASSEYFVKMLNSGLQESQTGTVEFKDLAPETLEIILDFLYLGNIDKLETELQLKNTLKATHWMQIKDLFIYCYNTLSSRLTNENFFELFGLFKMYTLENDMKDLLKFWVLNKKVVLESNQFLSLPFAELVDFIQFLKTHGVWMDNILTGVFSWIQHDMDIRSKLAIEMLTHIDFTLLSKPAVEQLLRSPKFQAMPKDFVVKFKELSVIVLLSDNSVYIHESLPIPEMSHSRTRLVFFSKNCNFQIFCPSKHFNGLARLIDRNCLQQFDLVTMSWIQPVCDVNPKFCSNPVISWKQKWLTFDAHEVSIYDPVNGTVGNSKIASKMCLMFDPLRRCSVGRYVPRSICHFKGHIYLIDWKYDEADISNSRPNPEVLYSSLNIEKWCSATSLPIAGNPLKVLASQCYMYVLNAISGKQIRIQYNSAPHKQLSWDITYVYTDGILTIENFFIFENTLHALYIQEGKTTHLFFSHSEKTMEAVTFPDHPEGVKKITRICPFIVNKWSILYISTEQGPFCIPNFSWNHYTGQWNALPAPSGKCEIPSPTNSFVVMS